MLIVGLILCFGCKSEKSEEQTSTKPNVVFIFAYDLTYPAINALGHSEVQTPSLNSLVTNGTTFTHTYNIGAWNGAVFAASRTMIISVRSVCEVDNFRQRWKKTRILIKHGANLWKVPDTKCT